MAKRRRRKRRGRRRNNSLIIIIILAILLCVAVGCLIFLLLKKPESDTKESESSGVVSTSVVGSLEQSTENTNAESTDSTEASTEMGTEIINPSDKTEESTIIYSSDELLAAAQKTAAMYDYDTAISMLTSATDYNDNQEYKDAVADFEEKKTHLVKWSDNTKITHIFFHTLVADNSLSFDGDSMSGNYNTVMTTISEFNKIIQSMYDKGYVMVSLHDIAKEVVNEDGSVTMKSQPIYLPEGKIPFVLSQDDVSYYAYMDGDGYATKLIIGSDGRITNEMKLTDGSVVTGSYDMIPLIEDFLDKHPDFSYHGARGIIALTGYEGVLGYRTSEYHYGANCAANDAKYQVPNVNIEADRQAATVVANELKKLGWEFATHGWGHIAMGADRAYDGFKWDIDMWMAEVVPIIGETDIVIYPKGDDIGTFRAYTDTEHQTELAVSKYQYLNSLGFRYFCNVDGSTPYWVQISGDYMRMGRINADGQALYEAVVDYRNKLSHIFSNDEIREIFDPERPTPVPGVPVN